MKSVPRTLAALAALVLSGAAVAQEQPVVVELYTSQGCSSCPPADALFEELAKRDDVIALALHVDYWDYIGWKDTFASPQYTQRQKGYAKAAGHRSIYTPQMVIGGRDHVIGYRPMEVADIIDTQRHTPPPAQISLKRHGAKLAVAIRPEAGLTGPLVVQMVRYDRAESVAIERGENAGRTINYSNVVTEWKRIAEWDGAAPLALEVPCEGPDSVAVILQRQGLGPILAAVALAYEE